MSGTIGQPDAGAMSGGGYTLAGGFWGLIAAVQTPGGPLLTVLNTGTNAVKVRWPNPSTGWVLQQNADLNTTNWVDTLLVPAVEGTNRYITVAPPAGKLLFRLHKP